ncbi:MAG: fatty acid desaturase [Acidobacteria bacterium]|nr:fatty acid desaturase [Acidobacteriota bacterium]
MHLACFGALFVHFNWWLVLALALSYTVRMFGVTAGYHRYFSHRSYKLGRVPQFLLAFLAQTSAQKGVLWWASHHRDHHRHSDSEQDAHSPKQHGFWHSHVGWILSTAHTGYDGANIKDFSAFPELRFLSKHHWICPWLLGVFAFKMGQWMGVGGLAGLMWIFLLPTVLLWHGTFTINSLCHVWGSRRFETTDTSRNNAILAFLTLGEGWHNNHHAYQASCRQGLRWWEFDPTYYALRMLGWLRIVRDIRRYPKGFGQASSQA